MVVSIFLILILKPLVQRYLGVTGELFTSRLSSKYEFYGEKIHLHPWTFLVLSLVVAVVGALYPYSPSINREGVAVGVDVYQYVEWMIPVEQDPYSAFTVEKGSRPIILLLIYGIQRCFGLEVLEAVKYLPILLNPLLVLSVFFMVLFATEDLEWAGLAAIFLASGFKITVGMYAYYLANMLGLVLIFLALGCLFKAIRTGNKAYLASASALGSLAIFSHPWAFTHYYVATILFLAYTCLREKPFALKSDKIVIFFYLVMTGFVNFFKGRMGGLEAFGSLSSASPNLIELANFWNNNIFAFRIKYGGYLSNTVLLGLAVIGVYYLSSRRHYHLFLKILMLVTLIYYLMVDGNTQTRLLYNIPFSVIAAYGILFLFRDIISDRKMKMAIISFIVIYMTVYLLRSLYNLL